MIICGATTARPLDRRSLTELSPTDSRTTDLATRARERRAAGAGVAGGSAEQPGVGQSLLFHFQRAQEEAAQRKANGARQSASQPLGQGARDGELRRRRQGSSLSTPTSPSTPAARPLVFPPSYETLSGVHHKSIYHIVTALHKLFPPTSIDTFSLALGPCRGAPSPHPPSTPAVHNPSSPPPSRIQPSYTSSHRHIFPPPTSTAPSYVVLAFWTPARNRVKSVCALEE